MAASDIRVHCLALGSVDLISPAGKMTMQVISAVAEFERDLLLERIHSGIALVHLSAGISVSAVAREFNTSRQTIPRAKAASSEG